MAEVATVRFAGKNYIDSLISGKKWAGSEVTFSFPDSKPADWAWQKDPSFEAFTDVQRDKAQAVIECIASYIDLDFAETTEAAGIIRFGEGETRTAASGMVGTGAGAGDTRYNHTHFETIEVGSYGWRTVLHEIGHSLGLKHPHGHSGSSWTVELPASQDATFNTVMSYNSYVGETSNSEDGVHSQSIAEGSYPETLMKFDIATLQYLYGANWDTDAGNTVYKFDPTEDKIFRTIWDGGGRDTYDLSGYTSGVQVDLRAGRWSIFSADQLANLETRDPSIVAPGNVANALLYKNNLRSLVESATGGSGDDVLTGNAVNNCLQGGAGSDTLTGGSGADKLFLGLNDSGADRVVYEQADESSTKRPDTVAWFDSGDGDVFDLSALSISGDDIVIQRTGTNKHMVQINANDDAEFEMLIHVTGRHLAVDDFLL